MDMSNRNKVLSKCDGAPTNCLHRDISVRARLNRLNGGREGYRLLALDHGLTVGLRLGASSSAIASTIEQCRDHIDGVVLNYGMAKLLLEGLPVNLILQCFGGPNGSTRVEVASVKSAVRLDACAVSVQFNVQHDCLADHAREIAKFTQEAHSSGFPVLFMTSGFDKSKSEEVADVVRICTEFGADLIKVELDTSREDESMIGLLRSSLCQSPPVLLAGGKEASDISSRLQAAMKMGFSGYCIGRSIFNAANPGSISQKFDEIVSKPYNEG